MRLIHRDTVVAYVETGRSGSMRLFVASLSAEVCSGSSLSHDGS